MADQGSIENDGIGFPNYIDALTSLEEHLQQEIKKESASPFIAHCEFSKDKKRKLIDSFRIYLHGEASMILGAFKNWPLTSLWNIATALSEDYGDDGGHAVYRVLNEAFGVDIVGDVRYRIISAFRITCRKYGLCYEGSERYVNDYLAQAGISKSQLHHVAKAFILAERAFGAAPVDSTSALNSWEDDAVHFLPPGVRIPRMVLEVDETAHYAFLYTRYRQKFAPRNTFEELFFDEVKKAENSVTGGHHATDVIPRPSLVWSHNRLALSVPKLVGRLSISVADVHRKLRGGQVWPLPTPWPVSICWEFQGCSDHVPVVLNKNHILVFEHDSGRLIGQFDLAGSDVLVDSRDVVFVSVSPFMVNGEPAYEVGTGGFASFCSLGGNSARVKIDSSSVIFRTKPKPRIWIEDGSIAKGPKGHLVGKDFSIGIEFGDLQDNEFDLALTVGGQERIEQIHMPHGASHAVHNLSGLNLKSSELVAVRAELRLRGSKRALVRYRAWFWASLRELQNGLVFESDHVPTNFSLDHSRFITQSGTGQLCLDNVSAYEKATLVFFVNRDRINFEIPRPGIVVSFTDVEGKTVPLKIGEPLILRDEEKGGSLNIRCPDRQATLNVRGRSEPQAFTRTSTRILSLADLLTPAASDEISIKRSEPGHVPVVVARIVPALCPLNFSVEQRAEKLELKIEMQIDVDAIRFILEDEAGNQEEYDHAIAYRPVTNRPANWLSAELDFSNTKQILIAIDFREFNAELSLAAVLVRQAGSDTFCHLRNARGDNYAVALKSFDDTYFETPIQNSDIRMRFMTLNSWMGQCFAQESWNQVGPCIQPRWMELGKLLVDSPNGLSHLLLAAHQSPLAGTAMSWVPLAHPMRILPSLYGSPANSFVSLATDSDEGSEHLALLAETAGRTIRELQREIGLSPAFLMAYENFAEAHKFDLKLRGFNFDEFSKLFQNSDINPGARLFWGPGNEMLGSAHYGAAIGRFVDRIYEAGLEDEGVNDARIRAATSLAHSAFVLKAETLHLPSGIEETHAVLEWAPSFFSGFARASRQDKAESYLESLAKGLERSVLSVIGDASFLVRLGPELLAYYLILWELASERKLQ